MQNCFYNFMWKFSIVLAVSLTWNSLSPCLKLNTAYTVISICIIMLNTCTSTSLISKSLLWVNSLVAQCLLHWYLQAILLTNGIKTIQMGADLAAYVSSSLGDEVEIFHRCCFYPHVQYCHKLHYSGLLTTSFRWSFCFYLHTFLRGMNQRVPDFKAEADTRSLSLRVHPSAAALRALLLATQWLLQQATILALTASFCKYEFHQGVITFIF